MYMAITASRNYKLRQLVDTSKTDRREAEAQYLTKLVAYTSKEAHSAIEKACKMAMVRVRPVRPDPHHFGLTGKRLEHAIRQDLDAGLIPFHIHATIGTTSTAAVDRLVELSAIAKKFVVYCLFLMIDDSADTSCGSTVTQLMRDRPCYVQNSVATCLVLSSLTAST